ncbi:hypothetical protein L596_002712 [Steinernema carpocapsae]|uniref:Uncharacterized protein n=1 Tax=Steinernema carpocapsae TaxID=34508 RepID=A0A4U8UQX9_STECR|nr:hypothetical protein L596_002712 [Steinernema carpocapsae]
MIVGSCFEKIKFETKRSIKDDKSEVVPEELVTLEDVDLESKFRDFGEMLLRMKRFWFRLPQSVCQEDQLAAPVDEKCWNGSSVHVDSFNISVWTTNRSTRNSGKYWQSRLRMSALADFVSAALEGTFKTVEYPEGSGEPDGFFFSDDEDLTVEGSGSDVIIEINQEDGKNVRIDDFWYESQKKAADRGYRLGEFTFVVVTGLLMRIWLN